MHHIKRLILTVALLLPAVCLSIAYAGEELPTVPPAVTHAPISETDLLLFPGLADTEETAAPEPTSSPAPTAAAQQPAVQPEPTPLTAQAGNDARSPQEILAEAARATQEPPEGVISLKLTCVGDCTLGGDVKRGDDKPFVNKANTMGLDYFFDNVRMIFQNDDITYVNLEGPLTTSKDIRRSTFNFKGSPEYVKILSGSSVELANLANNHMKDYDESGYEETKSVLSNAGIQYSGFKDVAIFDVKGVRVGSIGFTQWRYKIKDMEEAIREVRDDCDVLLVSIHWGVEGRERHSADQRRQAHRMIDAGADIVIGTHTHTYGGIELYNGKYIVYSLGNFCFGGNDDPWKKNTLIFQAVLNYDTNTRKVSTEGISIIPARISGRDDTNDFQPYILTGEKAVELLENIFSVSDTPANEVSWLPESYEVVYGLVAKPEPACTPAPFTGAVG